MTLLVLLVCCLLPLPARQSADTALVLAKDNHCEENRSYFDYVQVESEGEPLIIVARLGDGERGRALSWRRLHNIREYLTYIREMPGHKIIVAEGEPVKGRGRVEVYLRGRPVALFLVGRNEDINGVDCEGGESTRYYPWRKKSPLPVPKASPDVP